MANFDEAAERWKTVNIGTIFVDIVKSNEGSILDLLRSQLYQGEAGDGMISPQYYTMFDTFYAEMKNSMNPAPGFGHPDLFLTGEWYSKLFIQNADEDSFNIWNRDVSKTNKLVSGWEYGYVNKAMHPGYGMTIFELNENSLNQLRDVFRRIINMKIREIIKSN